MAESASSRLARWTQISGAVLPHAGLAFSARGISHAFQPAHPPYSRIVILSPSHYHPLPSNTLWVERFERHETPLGDVAGDPSFPLGLSARLGEEVVFAEEVVEGEHGTEMFLPFIKWHSPNARVSLVLVPMIDDETKVSRWSQTIAELLDPRRENTLVLMSSDFTHYGPRFGYTPFGSPSGGHDVVLQSVANDDLRFAESIAERDIRALFRRMERPITVCGRYPILLGGMILDTWERESAKIEGSVVDYYTSQTITGSVDKNFVCYGTILFGTAGGDR